MPILDKPPGSDRESVAGEEGGRQEGPREYRRQVTATHSSVVRSEAFFLGVLETF